MSILDFFGDDEQNESPGSDSKQSGDNAAKPLASEALDDSELSERQLRKRIRQANTEFEKADNRLKTFRKKAHEFLVKGSEANRDDKQKMLGLLVRQIRQRAAVMKLKQQTALRDLFEYTLQKEVQSIQEMLRQELNRESPMDHLEIDSDEFTEEFNEVAASVQAQTEEMTEMLQEVSNSVKGADAELALDTFPEEEEMDRIAKAKVDSAEDAMEFDVEMEEQAPTTEVDDNKEVGVEFGGTEQVEAADHSDDDDDDDLARSLAS